MVNNAPCTTSKVRFPMPRDKYTTKYQFIKMKIEEIITKLKSFIDVYPQLVGNEAVNFFKDNFKKQGWQGETFEKWPARKKNEKGPIRPILIKNRTLEQSIQRKLTTPNEVIVGTAGQIPYARIHNEGGQIHQAARSETFVRNRYKKKPMKGKFRKGTKPGRGFTFGERTINMPKRQFIGDSPVLRERLKKMAIDEIKNALKS